MPIASTKPKSDRLFSENPNIPITASVPISETGTAIIGTIVARQSCKEHEHHQKHEHKRLDQRLEHFVDRFVDKYGRVVVDSILDSLRESLAELFHFVRESSWPSSMHSSREVGRRPE